jgi:hypothetical protein
VVAHAYKYQLLGRQRSGGSLFKASPGKKFMKPHLNQQLGVVAHTCLPSSAWKYKWEDGSSSQPGHKLYTRIAKAKSVGTWLSDRASA